MWSCTAALIGPKTAITAANCLYNHAEEGGWRDKVVFWPAVNGENNAPYGGFDYDTEYVFQAYITDYDGTYDGIWQYDHRARHLQGSDRRFARLAGLHRRRHRRFPGHRSSATTTTSRPSPCGSRPATCLPKTSRQADIVHDCDSTGGTDGAPLYYYDQANKSRMVVGINIGPSGDANWALKLTPGLVAVDQLGQPVELDQPRSLQARPAARRAGRFACRVRC